jgi:16S rRNA (cytosine967-C5)-methyltransferase
MASPRALMAAEEIIDRWITERDRSALDRIVQYDLRGRRYLNSAERRWIGDAVFGSVRYWRRQNTILEQLGLEPTPRQIIELWSRQETAGSPEDADLHQLPGPDSPREHLRHTLSFPDEIARSLEALLGAEAVQAAAALNRQAPVTVRVNTLRTTRSKVLERLPGSAPARFSPWGVDIGLRTNIHELAGFRDGWFELQEEASQLIALLTDARPGQTVVDVGAGAGGKSLALAAMIGNDGAVIAIDTSEERLARMTERAARAGATAIRPLPVTADADGCWQLSGRKQRTVEKLIGAAACVLVDAPCSGTGVLRRSPDLKWRAVDQEELARMQSLLLEQAAAFVSLSGALIYATCAFEHTQNEAVIDRFLRSEAGHAFEIEPALPRLAQAVERAASADGDAADVATSDEFAPLMSGPFLRTWPHRSGLDAFFAACLTRVR